jgi:hypothetical protein
MKVMLVIVLIMVTSISVAARDDAICTLRQEYNGLEFVSILTTNAFERMPNWEYDRAPPPLSPDKAIRLCRNMLAMLLPEEDTEKWNPGGVTLMPIQYIAEVKWVYLIGWNNNPPASRADPPTKLSLFVTMDGVCIPPSVQKLPKPQ